jgi:flagellar hook protein FlgE
VYNGLDGAALTAASPSSTLTFSTSGVLTSAATLTKTFPVATGAVTPLNFDVDVSNMTQFGAPFAVNDLTQNGFAPGNLAGVSVSKDGIVQARSDNGQTRDIGQVALFNFRNPNGLTSIGNNQWTETGDSGQPTPGNPNTGIFGVLQASAVEESNVDLTAELVNLIVQQRNYQASAQSIKTQDQILQNQIPASW